jgi:hypothetical protein
MIKNSQICRAEDFDTEWFKMRKAELGEPYSNWGMIRKLWEFCIIAQIIKEEGDRVYNVGFDTSTHYALGFGCGTDPIARWIRHYQNYKDVIASDIEVHFNQLQIDMRDIPKEYRDERYHLIWSSCALEHIGGRKAGIDFIFNSLECLKPGGLAVHTTEFNFDPIIGKDKKYQTIDAKDLCLYLEDDLLDLEARLKKEGHHLWPLDLKQGNRSEDKYIDPEPYYSTGIHINLYVNKHHPTTSVLLVIRK